MVLSFPKIEILRDLLNRLSRNEITANHDLSFSKLKLIINIIFEKLHVHNITDIVCIATE